jgi:hypothetical protein
MHTTLRFIARVLVGILGLVVLGFAACIFPWITTLGVLSTEHPSDTGMDGALIWHSGLPFRFLTRTNISVGATIDSMTYWLDVAFWLVAFWLFAVQFRRIFRRLQINAKRRRAAAGDGP